MGERLYRLSARPRAEPVDPGGDSKRVSQRNHLRTPISRPWRNCAGFAARPPVGKGSGTVEAHPAFAGRTRLVLKLKTQDFKLRTRQPPAWRSDPRMDDRFSNALDLLRRETDGTEIPPARHSAPPVSRAVRRRKSRPPDLVDVQFAQRRRCEGDMDTLRDSSAQGGRTGYTSARAAIANPLSRLEE